MRKSGRLLAAIALIALLLASGVPAAAEPAVPSSWFDFMDLVEAWIGRLIAPGSSEPVMDTDDSDSPEPAPRPDDGLRLLQSDRLHTINRHDETFPGMDPDG